MRVVDVVQYNAGDWYARITLPDGRTWHSDPWRSRTAAEYHARALRQHPLGYMRRNSGNR